MKEYSLIIVGGGAAGILCAIEAAKKGIDKILLIEKEPTIGGALNLGDYNISENEKITGKQYKNKILKELDEYNIDIKLNTMVLKIKENNIVLCTSSQCGVEEINGKNIILTNGAKECSRKSVDMVGDRCSGILTTGMAKKIFNLGGVVPGKNILIDGTATLHMIEKDIKEHNINIVGIIPSEKDFNVYGLTNKIYEDYTITNIEGNSRVNKVTLTKGKESYVIDCDTLLFARPMLSDGLVAMRSDIKLNPDTKGPEVDDKFMTSRQGIYACGNGIYIHRYIEEIEKECKKLIEAIV